MNGGRPVRVRHRVASGVHVWRRGVGGGDATAAQPGRNKASGQAGGGGDGYHPRDALPAPTHLPLSPLYHPQPARAQPPIASRPPLVSLPPTSIARLRSPLPHCHPQLTTSAGEKKKRPGQNSVPPPSRQQAHHVAGPPPPPTPPPPPRPPRRRLRRYARGRCSSPTESPLPPPPAPPRAVALLPPCQRPSPSPTGAPRPALALWPELPAESRCPPADARPISATRSVRATTRPPPRGPSRNVARTALARASMRLVAPPVYWSTAVATTGCHYCSCAAETVAVGADEAGEAGLLAATADRGQRWTRRHVSVQWVVQTQRRRGRLGEKKSSGGEGGVHRQRMAGPGRSRGGRGSQQVRGGGYLSHERGGRWSGEELGM